MTTSPETTEDAIERLHRGLDLMVMTNALLKSAGRKPNYSKTEIAWFRNEIARLEAK
jgi:hypothetical protein